MDSPAQILLAIHCRAGCLPHKSEWTGGIMQSTSGNRSAPSRAAAARATNMALLEEQIERLKSRMRLAVVFGGNKSAPDSVIYRSHNTRSWKSYEAVAQDIVGA